MIDFHEPVKHIYSRSDFNFILTLNGDCYSWGTNVFGRLGFPKTISSQKIPTKIKSLTKIKSVSMGIHHCIAIT
jgi:alpha-tubulin suppressor-like RCC1 family protein